jgi:hypothetical protein
MNTQKCGRRPRGARVADMKFVAGVALGIGLMLGAVFLPGCATWHQNWEAKCGPQVDPLLKPCSCMDARTLSCPKPPTDAKKPKTNEGASK